LSPQLGQNFVMPPCTQEKKPTLLEDESALAFPRGVRYQEAQAGVFEVNGKGMSCLHSKSGCGSKMWKPYAGPRRHCSVLLTEKRSGSHRVKLMMTPKSGKPDRKGR